MSKPPPPRASKGFWVIGSPAAGLGWGWGRSSGQSFLISSISLAPSVWLSSDSVSMAAESASGSSGSTSSSAERTGAAGSAGPPARAASSASRAGAAETGGAAGGGRRRRGRSLGHPGRRAVGWPPAPGSPGGPGGARRGPSGRRRWPPGGRPGPPRPHRAGRRSTRSRQSIPTTSMAALAQDLVAPAVDEGVAGAGVGEADGQPDSVDVDDVGVLGEHHPGQPATVLGLLEDVGPQAAYVDQAEAAARTGRLLGHRRVGPGSGGRGRRRLGDDGWRLRRRGLLRPPASAGAAADRRRGRVRRARPWAPPAWAAAGPARRLAVPAAPTMALPRVPAGRGLGSRWVAAGGAAAEERRCAAIGAAGRPVGTERRQRRAPGRRSRPSGARAARGGPSRRRRCGRRPAAARARRAARAAAAARSRRASR